MAGKGILLDDSGDLKILNKEVVIGNSEMQEVAVLLQMNQGEQKFHPLLGTNLVELINTKKSRFEIEKRVKISLIRDNKDYANIKDKIKTSVL